MVIEPILLKYYINIKILIVFKKAWIYYNVFCHRISSKEYSIYSKCQIIFSFGFKFTNFMKGGNLAFKNFPFLLTSIFCGSRHYSLTQHLTTTTVRVLLPQLVTLVLRSSSALSRSCEARCLDYGGSEGWRETRGVTGGWGCRCLSAVYVPSPSVSTCGCTSWTTARRTIQETTPSSDHISRRPSQHVAWSLG